MASITDRIKKPSELTHLKALIYGNSGAGKTWALGTAGLDSRTSPILILDTERGTHTLKNAPNVDVFEVTKPKDFADVYAYLESGKHPYKTVAIDSVSETHLAGLMEVANIQLSGDATDVQIRDYYRVLNRIRHLLRSFRDLPLNVLFTALAQTANDPKAGSVKKPAMVGQMADEILGMFDASIYLGLVPMKGENNKNVLLQENQRVMFLKNHAGVMAKIRTFTPNTPDEIKNITWDTPLVSYLLNTLNIGENENG